MKTQHDLFEQLIQNKNPGDLQNLWDAARVLDWQEESIPFLSPDDVISILHRYLKGELSSVQVESWANLMEAAGIALGGIAHEDVKSAVDELANPVLEGALTYKRAQTLMEQLQQS